MNSPLYAIYGASGCGRGIMPLARKQLEFTGIDRSRLIFVDDAPAAAFVNDHRVLRYEDFLNEDASEHFVTIAIADGRMRADIAARCSADQVSYWTVRAENAVLMDDVLIGEGAVLSPFVTLTSNIRIGMHFHCNLYSYVEHDCVIGDFVTFAPGVKCNGNIIVEDYAYIGSGAVLRQGRPGSPLRIGCGAVVGMGAVVTRDVAPGSMVAGNPARQLDQQS